MKKSLSVDTFKKTRRLTLEFWLKFSTALRSPPTDSRKFPFNLLT